LRQTHDTMSFSFDQAISPGSRYRSHCISTGAFVQVLTRNMFWVRVDQNFDRRVWRVLKGNPGAGRRERAAEAEIVAGWPAGGQGEAVDRGRASERVRPRRQVVKEH
jgi:hypothetical protein